MKNRLAFMMVGIIVFLFSCAHRELKLPELAPSATNASQVNIIREDRFFGFGMPLTVMFDDAIICSLRAGEYVTFAVEPGIHTLGLSHAMAIMPFEPQKNYYFYVTTSHDQFGFEIERIDDERGKHFISKSKIFE